MLVDCGREANENVQYYRNETEPYNRNEKICRSYNEAIWTHAVVQLIGLLVGDLKEKVKRGLGKRDLFTVGV